MGTGSLMGTEAAREEGAGDAKAERWDVSGRGGHGRPIQPETEAAKAGVGL